MTESFHFSPAWSFAGFFAAGFLVAALALPAGARLAGALLSACMLVALGWVPHAGLAAYLPLLMLGTFCYGLISPNAVHGALHPMPHIAGVAGAALGFVQMAVGAAASALVAWFDDGRSAHSMSLTMVLCCASALLTYLAVARPAQRRRLAQPA